MVDTTKQIIQNQQDPAIESYRLGLLSDVQGLTQQQVFGQSVQDLRSQINPETGVAYTNEEIRGKLTTGTAASDDYVAATDDAAQIGTAASDDYYQPEEGAVAGISQDALYRPSDYQVAGLTPAEQAASAAAQTGVGAYQPYLDSGAKTLQGASGVMADAALPYMQQGVASLSGSDAQYDPTRALGIAQRGMEQYVGTDQQYDPSQTIGNTYGAIDDMGTTTGMYDPTQTVGNTYGAIASMGQTGVAYDPTQTMGNTYDAMNKMGQTTGAYDPTSARGYMNEYEDQAVQQALADVARAGQTQQAQLGANASAAGAFGGSRQGVAQAEIGRNTLEQQGRTAAGMRQAGYESAAQRSQEAFERQQGRGQTAAQQQGAMGLAAGQFDQGSFENTLARRQAAAQQQSAMGLAAGQFDQGAYESAMGRRQTAAQQRGELGLAAGQYGQGTYENAMARRQAAAQGAAGIGMSGEQFAAGGLESALGRRQSAANIYGQLGQGVGSLGAQMGQLGIQQAGLGEMYSGLNAQDMQNLMVTGANERGVQQAGLDAKRLSDLQRYSQPYQQYGFLSDVYSGTPTGSSAITASSAPQVSPFQTAVGLGITGLAAAGGAKKAGLFS